MIKLIRLITFLLLGIILVTGCRHEVKPADENQKFVISDSLLKTLKIDTVIKCPLVYLLTLTGKVSFNEDKVARIYPLVSGIINDVNVQLGDQVTKGQRLGVIRSGEMAGYGNDLVTAKTNLLVAKKILTHLKKCIKVAWRLKKIL